MRGGQFLAAGQADGDVPRASGYPLHVRAKPQIDALAPEGSLDLRRYVRILPPEEMLAMVDDRRARAEAAKHLCKLAADVAAAEDGEVPGNLADLHDRAVVQPGDLLQSLDGRHGRPRSRVDHHHLGLVHLPRDLHPPFAHETGVSAEDGEA